MKIAIINHNHTTYYKDLYEELGKLADVHYITLDRHNDSYKGKGVRLKRELVIPSIDVLKTHELETKTNTKTALFRAARYYRILKKIKPDLIIVRETSVFNLKGFLYAYRNDVPLLISTEIGISNLGNYPPHVRIVRKIMSRFVNGVIAHSPAAIHSDFSVGKNKIARSYHAISCQKHEIKDRPDIGEKIKLVYLGKLVPRKGLDLLFEAMRIAISMGVKVVLNVIGGGDEEWTLKEMNKRGIGEHVVYRGYLEGEELFAALEENEIFVLPSRFDTYGAVTHEASCAGLALLISKNAGSHVMVESGVNGYVFDPDNAEEFAECLISLMDVKRRRSMMDASRKSAQEYSAENNAANILKVAESFIK